MNVGEYRSLLADLELKKAELMNVHDQYAYGYAKTVLADAQVKVQAEIDELMSLELMPVPYVISISSLTTVSATVGETVQLSVTARMSDGSARDVTKAKYASASYKDYDTMFNNAGIITNVDVGGYTLDRNEKYRIVKTSSGWNVYDSTGTDGLTVASDVDPNTFKIVDIDGNEIGVKFVTDGNEAKGDNWTIDVNVALTGTVYTSSDTGIVTVDGNGGITGVAAGTAQVTITNNNSTITVDVTVA